MTTIEATMVAEMVDEIDREALISHWYRDYG
jgi:hypothetical protein